MGNHFKFLNEPYSTNMIINFRLLYDEVVKSGIKKEQHLKYILTPEHIKDHYLEKFPWIKNLPMYDYTDETIVFFRLNPTWTNGDQFHPHVDPLDANANLNIPVYNCTSETTTTWLEPIGKIESKIGNWKGSENVEGETKSHVLKSEYKLIEQTTITDRCCLFKGDVWHRVNVFYTDNRTRVMCKVWSRGILWDNLLEHFKEEIDHEYRIPAS